MLIYIHGFNGSPLSFKARLVRERMAAIGRGAEFACPELDHGPISERHVFASRRR